MPFAAIMNFGDAVFSDHFDYDLSFAVATVLREKLRWLRSATFPDLKY